MIRRRKLLIALGVGLLAAPFGFAQRQAPFWRVGYVSGASRPGSLDSDHHGAFRQGMRELGYVEGKNLVIEWRFANGKYERLPALVTELVELKVDVIVAVGTTVTSAAQKGTTTTPIVMSGTADPVVSGFVKSLARPGGNITGLSNLTVEVSAKYLEMLLGMVPKLSRVAVLLNPTNSGHATILEKLRTAAHGANVNILPAHARTLQDIEVALSMAAKKNAGAVIILRDPFFNQHGRRIAELAAQNRLPSISGTREYAEGGGLMSYGPSLVDNLRRAATYVDKILKGAKPGDLPVEQPTKFELLINRKTAKALGLTVPQSLLISADKVIE